MRPTISFTEGTRIDTSQSYSPALLHCSGGLLPLFPLPVWSVVTRATSSFLQPSRYTTIGMVSKLEIERRYWARRNIDRAIVTEHEISRVLARNVQKLHKHLTIEDRVALPEAIIQEATAMMTSEVLQSTCSLSYIALECDERLGLQPGTSLTIAYYLMATRQWKTDMSTPIQPGNRLILLSESF
jgi:hypothetical protein